MRSEVVSKSCARVSLCGVRAILQQCSAALLTVWRGIVKVLLPCSAVCEAFYEQENCVETRARNAHKILGVCFHAELT